MKKRISRRSLFVGASSLVAISVQSSEDVLSAPSEKRKTKSDTRQTLVAGVRIDGNYVPVTIAVPDSIASGEAMAFTLTTDGNLSPQTTYGLYLRAYVDASNYDNRILGAPNAGDSVLTLIVAESTDSYATAFVTLYNPDNVTNSEDLLVMLQGANNSAFNNTGGGHVTDMSGQIDVYK